MKQRVYMSNKEISNIGAMLLVAFTLGFGLGWVEIVIREGWCFWKDSSYQTMPSKMVARASTISYGPASQRVDQDKNPEIVYEHLQSKRPIAMVCVKNKPLLENHK